MEQKFENCKEMVRYGTPTPNILNSYSISLVVYSTQTDQILLSLEFSHKRKLKKLERDILTETQTPSFCILCQQKAFFEKRFSNFINILKLYNVSTTYIAEVSTIYHGFDNFIAFRDTTVSFSNCQVNKYDLNFSLIKLFYNTIKNQICIKLKHQSVLKLRSDLVNRLSQYILSNKSNVKVTSIRVDGIGGQVYMRYVAMLYAHVNDCEYIHSSIKKFHNWGQLEDFPYQVETFFNLSLNEKKIEDYDSIEVANLSFLSSIAKYLIFTHFVRPSKNKYLHKMRKDLA